MTARPTFKLEKTCLQPVCGVDEAGRGPWAGPVFAAAVILAPRKVPKGLNDSKKLTALQREALEAEIRDRAVCYSVAFATVEEIESHNILQATGLAMRRAVEGLSVRPAFALVDGNYRFALPCEIRPVIGGDALSASIAAASILAKVARDRVMIELDGAYPGYGFADHKGYHAPAHVEALKRLGPCPIHRRSFAPIRALLEAEFSPAAE
ncbi:ribonuclease HII [Brevundimonas sp. 2R-24]|uniref:Ribonuclease HII n=1 Tax=Peiella sedimenti TaxID=3061083 RepID=A0ABT8SR86_9CAUL|nr:ribonuclease HII [Caulobacteraceae bacterium XZ-24]